jgi:ribokinase
MPQPRIAVVGSANTDMVIKADRIPAPGETVIGREFVMAPGGKGANQAVAAARLGTEVTFIARLGSDVFGDRAIAGYEQEGIDTTWIVRDPETASGVALIFVDEAGENSIAVASGANARLTPEDVACAREAIASAHVLLVQLEVPLAAVSRAIEFAHSAGVRVILNPAPAREVPTSLLSRVSIATPNEHEIKVVVGESDRTRSVAKMLDAGTQTVLVTLGAQGVLWADKGLQVLAYALASELTMQEAIRYASAAAAIAVTRMGAQPSLPTRTEVEAFLRQAGN